MRDIPFEVIASWPIPNYENPPTRGNALIIVNSIFIGLTILAVGLRVYVRTTVNRWVGADDYCIIIALVFAIGLAVSVLLANVSYGWDRHVWDIRLELIASTFLLIPLTSWSALIGMTLESYQIAFTTKCVFALAAMFTRMSLMLFYYRLVKDSGMHKYRMVIHASQVFSVIVGLFLCFLTIWQCKYVQVQILAGLVLTNAGRSKHSGHFR